MDDPVGNPLKRDLLIPDLCSEVIFNFDSVYHRYHLTPSEAASVTMSCITGQRSHSILANRPDKVRLFGIKLTPGSLFTLFNIPERDLKNKSIPVYDLMDHGLSKLEQEVFGLKNIKEAPLAIDKFLQKRLWGKDLSELNFFHRCLNDVARLDDVSQLESVRSLHGLHYKKMERLFARYGGISAGNYVKINRFKKFYKSFHKGNEAFYNNSIYDFGYYDQNHFIKDFQHYTGQNPTKYYQLKTNLTDTILIRTLNLLKGED
jgi:AraC-like DNA-binding protein